MAVSHPAQVACGCRSSTPLPPPPLLPSPRYRPPLRSRWASSPDAPASLPAHPHVDTNPRGGGDPTLTRQQRRAVRGRDGGGTRRPRDRPFPCELHHRRASRGCNEARVGWGGRFSQSRSGRNGILTARCPPLPGWSQEAILRQGRPHRSSPVAVSPPSPPAYVRRSVRIARGGWLARGGATRGTRWPPCGVPAYSQMDRPRATRQSTAATAHCR